MERVKQTKRAKDPTILSEDHFKQIFSDALVDQKEDEQFAKTRARALLLAQSQADADVQQAQSLAEKVKIYEQAAEETRIQLTELIQKVHEKGFICSNCSWVEEHSKLIDDRPTLLELLKANNLDMPKRPSITKAHLVVGGK